MSCTPHLFLLFSDVRLDEFVYELPPSFVAQYPRAERDESRLLVLDRATGHIEHRVFRDICDYFEPGDCLVLNETKVIPAQLCGTKPTGGKAEVLLVGARTPKVWQVLVNPGRRTRVGTRIVFDERLSGRIAERDEKGRLFLEFDQDDPWPLIEELGRAPLPPYIRRPADKRDRQTYQTVYAREPGAIAAPTAGLHFTDRLLDEVRRRDVDIVFLTLHIGIGTFQPVKTVNVEDHRMAPEHFTLARDAAERIRRARRVWAVGTSTVRVLETTARKGTLQAMTGSSDLFVYPGFGFRIVDRLITNFHLPASTPLLLVCAFASRAQVFAAYEEAKRQSYRFLSYGDAMALL